MIMQRRLFVLVLAATLAGCAGRTRLESDLRVRGAPDWVNKGTAYVDDKGGRLFHGVGSAGPAGDDALQRAIADDRARAEVARIFSSYLDVATRDYQAAGRAGEARTSEEALSRQVHSLTKVIARGCTYTQVAEQLGMSAHTVASHIKNTYRKLDVHCAAAAVMRAIELQLLGETRQVTLEIES